jgi:hypothetical protein
MAQQPLLGQVLIEASRSHSDTPLSVRPLWTCDQPDAEASTTHSTHKRQTYMPSAGFESAIPACACPETYALDRAATGIGHHLGLLCRNFRLCAASFCMENYMYVIDVLISDLVHNDQ